MQLQVAQGTARFFEDYRSNPIKYELWVKGGGKQSPQSQDESRGEKVIG